MRSRYSTFAFLLPILLSAVSLIDRCCSGWVAGPVPIQTLQQKRKQQPTQRFRASKGPEGNAHLNLFNQNRRQNDHVAHSSAEDGTKEVARHDAAPVKSTRLRSKRIEWEVYVDQSKASLERGGSATLDAFIGLATPAILVRPAIFPKTKAKGPVVRCISLLDDQNGPSFEVANVDSVDKVHRIFTRHMNVRVNRDVCECLKWKYRGNGYLEAGKVTLAIEAYGKALDAAAVGKQEGAILLMRASAYMQRAAGHKQELKDIVNSLVEMVPGTSTTSTLFNVASKNAALANAIFRRVLARTDKEGKQFRQTQYQHGLYQYTLLQAAHDALRATQLLPTYATSWMRAGAILSELWKLKESAQYYERAIELDSSLAASLTPVIDGLRKRQDLLDNSRAYGWSEDMLRLALDSTTPIAVPVK